MTGDELLARGRPTGEALTKGDERAHRSAQGTLSPVVVSVRLFAVLRKRAGADCIELELPAGSRVRDALAALDHLAEGMTLVLAVNREYAADTQELFEGDELALVPPVSGGAGAVHAAMVDGTPSVDALLARVRDPRAGAVVTFSGVTRENAWLEYEAYTEMAEAKLRSVAEAALERHGLCAVAVEHRTGRVLLGEASVVVAASAPHRAEAFAGAREVIDELKLLVPIWKSEEGEWVRGTPPPTPPPTA